jgi:hypothetical protein
MHSATSGIRKMLADKRFYPLAGDNGLAISGLRKKTGSINTDPRVRIHGSRTLVKSLKTKM